MVRSKFTSDLPLLLVYGSILTRFLLSTADDRRNLTKSLVANGQLEFINGAWCDSLFVHFPCSLGDVLQSPFVHLPLSWGVVSHFPVFWFPPRSFGG